MELHKIREELEKDFKSEVSKIDFCNYDPASREFMAPLSIGMMLMVLDEEKEEEDNPVEDEVMDAMKYAKKYKNTGRSEYKVLASDELRHASILSSIKGVDINKYAPEIDKVHEMIM